MARARNIKPSFFKNELLAEMDAFDRLLFVGLWCLADREGRIEDRPKRIKMELFPCDGYDVDAGLATLEKHGFVTRYQAGEVAVVAVVNFHKHQTPHGTEKDSELPDENGDLTVNERTSNGYVSGKKRVNNVNSQESNRHSPLDNGAGTVNLPGHNALNPDSLNPDSLIEAKASLPPVKPADPPGFANFWKAWPSNDRKQAKGKCLDAWKKAHAERDAALILAHVESLKQTQSWRKNSGEFIPAPLVYLNNRRWEGADLAEAAEASGVGAFV